MAAEEGKIKSLMAETKKAADTILEHVEKREGILILSHLDADGLAAAGIMGASLSRIGAAFHIRIERWLDENVIKELSSEKDRLVILTDMGSGHLNLLNPGFKGKLVILDHHQPIEKANEGFVHVNPHLYGIDGAREISGAGVAYFVARALSEKNMDLACIGVVGALGDMQDKNADHRLGGANEPIVADAIKAGCLKTETDLLFFGRETRPIHKALAYTTTPFIPGISGEEDKSLEFLINSVGVKPKDDDKWRALRDLTQEEKQRLFSKLSDYLASKGFRSEVAMSLLGTVYILPKEEPWTPLRDGREFALLLNSTGRTGKPSLGVAICMGDRGSSLEEANRALDEYRQTIMKYLRWLDENPDRIEEMGNIYVLRGEQSIDEKAISAISTILSSSMPNSEKPIIAYSAIPEENLAKISARTVDALTKKGLNLGEIMRTAAEKYSGVGGGHDVAAGAQVPYEQKENFLNYVNELVKEQLQRKSHGSQNNLSL
jgi:RecJ-like exonuclease